VIWSVPTTCAVIRIGSRVFQGELAGSWLESLTVI